MMPKRLVAVLFVFVAVAGTLIVLRTGIISKFKTGTHETKSALYYCPMHPTYTSDKPGDCPICNMKLVKREDHEQEPVDAGHVHESIPVQVGEQEQPSAREFTVEELVQMKPGEICLIHKCKTGTCLIAMTPEWARLGKCPHCGEDLGVIVKEALPEGYGNVRLSSEKTSAIGIKTGEVKKIQMTKTIRTVGRIAYDPDLYQAEEELIQAARAFEKAELGSIPEVKEQAGRLVESATIRLRLLGLSDSLIDEVKQAGKPDRSLLYSEAGGTVWLYAPIYEYEIPLVKVGDTIDVEVPAFPEKKFQGAIRSIDPVVDPVTRSIRARAVLQNPEGFLKPEMYVNAILERRLGEVLAVPEEAVFATGEQNIVFVAKPDGVFEPRQVTVGVKSGEDYEVKSGLSEGETVVTSGNFLIDSESRLKAALQSVGGEGHKHG